MYQYNKDYLWFKFFNFIKLFKQHGCTYMYNMEEISINSFSLFAYNLQKKLLRNHKLKSKGRFHCIDINAGDCTKVNFFSTFRFLSVLNHLSRSMALNLPSSTFSTRGQRTRFNEWPCMVELCRRGSTTSLKLEPVNRRSGST